MEGPTERTCTSDEGGGRLTAVSCTGVVRSIQCSVLN